MTILSRAKDIPLGGPLTKLIEMELPEDLAREILGEYPEALDPALALWNLYANSVSEKDRILRAEKRAQSILTEDSVINYNGAPAGIITRTRIIINSGNINGIEYTGSPLAIRGGDRILFDLDTAGQPVLGGRTFEQYISNWTEPRYNFRKFKQFEPVSEIIVYDSGNTHRRVENFSE